MTSWVEAALSLLFEDSVEQGTPTTPKALIASIEKGFVRPGFASVRSGPVPKRMRRSVWRKPGSWLYFQLRSRGTFEEARGYWQGTVATGVFAWESRRKGWPVLRGHSFSYLLSGGRTEYSGSSTILLRAGPPRKPSPVEVHERALAGAKAGGVTLIEVRMNRPLGWIAPEVVVSTPNPEEFLAERGLNIQRILRPVTVDEDDTPFTEGSFLEVRDPEGRIVTTAGYAIRTGQGIGL